MHGRRFACMQNTWAPRRQCSPVHSGSPRRSIELLPLCSGRLYPLYTDVAISNNYRDILIPVITPEFKVVRCVVIGIDDQELPSVSMVSLIASCNIEIRIRKGILKSCGLGPN